MRPAETTPQMGVEEDKGDLWKEWIQVWCIIRTFVNVTIYSQYSNKKKVKVKKRIENIKWILSRKGKYYLWDSFSGTRRFMCAAYDVKLLLSLTTI
jgi:hypothetical protein